VYIHINRHVKTKLEEMAVEGILAFFGRVLPRAADPWVQSLSTNDSACSSCSSRKASHQTETALLKPPSPLRHSANYDRLQVVVKGWWTRAATVGTGSTAGCAKSIS
jgi:hypothetical protein